MFLCFKRIKRVLSPLRIITVFALLALCSGCLLKKSDASLHPEALQLKIAPDTNVVHVGDKVKLNFELVNMATVPMKVYVRTGRSGYTLKGTEKLLSFLNVVDHPSPNQAVWLKTGESINWNEQIEILPVGVGHALLSAGIEIYHPKSCDKYGCDPVSIGSNQIELNIAP